MSGTELSFNGFDSTTGGFQSYLSYANSQPILTEDQEKQLFTAYIESNELDAARQIVLSHLRFVVFIAKDYLGYGLPMEDLVQEGSVGLMKSVKRFDLNYGVRFATYAVHRIKSEIHEYVIRNWKLVKVATTKAQRKLFFNLRSLTKRLGWMSQDEVNEVATYLNVSEKDVVDMQARLRQADEFFDETFGDSIDEKCMVGAAHSKLLEDCSRNPETYWISEDFNHWCLSSISGFVEKLDERSKDILISRWLVKDEDNRVSLKELAGKYSISSERVRQIESRVLERLKAELLEKGLELDDY
ncbi:RNA polymerase sigma factor RpoH [Vibrio sp. MACH09]|uniref:RNA polymerase factor sigma-32 n=1 Tax=Vibrio sp. MACH09 TaxID=3025122 RepID=UPI00278F944D|nr:RNA polymerase factor sigma-32 [Vibrio sp. MACH09]GLO64136.1 RNA polymerase sigma factor RpoH [Vibrio sp. MACH09]